MPAQAGTNVAATLAQTYSPVVALHVQMQPCGPGEAYRPTVVDLVLDNPEVVLRDPLGRVVKRAPTAQDLSRAPFDDYLDLPGDPLNPGCGYEKQFRRWYGDRSPSVYAHVASDSEHPGRLAVQYWFYYTFNDFTDKHESDWEMIQVDFDAASAEQALKTGPYEVDLAQHAGGEKGSWLNDAKLSKQGTHPVTYVATGSHSDYFQSRLYLGKGGTAIFGCEDTGGASTRLDPRTVLLPDTPVPGGSPYAWLSFEGRWGQKEFGINNGPFGPAAHLQWEHPISWSEGLRTSSLVVPSVKVVGISATGLFCTLTTASASVFDWVSVHPSALLALLGVIAVGLITAARRTAWNPLHHQTLRQARDVGQMLRSARRLYGANASTFFGIGLIFIPVAALAGGVQWVLFHLTGVRELVAVDGKGGVGTAFVALLIGGVAGAIAAVAVTAAVSAALGEIDAGHGVTARQACGLGWRNVRSVARATAMEIVILVLLSLTVIGIPVAIWLFIRTRFFAQACVLDHHGANSSMRASAALIRGRWWRTFGFTGLIDVVAILSGPVLGVLILLLTSQSLTFINIVGSIIYAACVPYAAIALTLYYFDLQARQATRPAQSEGFSGAGDPGPPRRPGRSDGKPQGSGA